MLRVEVRRDAAVESARAYLTRRFGRCEQTQIEFFVELGEPALQCCDEQLRGHRSEDAVVSSGVVTKRSFKLRRHQRGVTRSFEQVVEAGHELQIMYHV
jgi:hypothetical protein